MESCWHSQVQNLIVHFRRVVLGSSHKILPFPSVDQHFECLPDLLLVETEGNLLLQLHDGSGTIRFYLVRNLVPEILMRRGILFVRIGKYTQPFKSEISDEIQQFRRKPLSVSPGNPVRTVVRRATSGTCVRNFCSRSSSFARSCPLSHGGKNLIIHMLNGNIQVVADLLLGGHQPDHLFRKPGGISVVKTDPFQLFNFHKLMQKFWQCSSAIEVNARKRSDPEQSGSIL